MSGAGRSRRRRAMREAARCPDCNSDVTVGAARDITLATVAHDDTCPWFRARAPLGGIYKELRVVESEREQPA